MANDVTWLIPRERVTVRFLEDHNACLRQIAKFAQTFPDGCELTSANVWIAFDAGLDLDWVVRRLLKGHELDRYYLARRLAVDEFRTVTAPKLAKYFLANDQAESEFARGVLSLYELVNVSSRVAAEYKSDTKQAMVVCERAKVQAFIDALELEDGPDGPRGNGVHDANP